MKPSIFLVLDNLRSLYNIGSLFRSADAFGVEKIFICGISGYPAHRQMEKIAKTALGAEQSVPWEYHARTATVITRLKKSGVSIVALETGKKSKPLNLLQPKFPLALVLGNEVTGIAPRLLKRCDQVAAIPQQGVKESLNVSVAGAIALYELSPKK